ncbi:4'-phosphopantetheinyl transferase superfamily protein [Streptomyces sp. XY332]|uniref:4'-phosphopantetheinyl transferase superfamily protein n=1 Tax=Streptomyces sp. XY332 TaxID=1415561 RepID=UPI00131CC55E|nr:4'-phosphopantetheinyl transferase superfamily protein [Streptomyces sp. XY332]
MTNAAQEVCWDRLLFSAKEAVFKVWYPITKRELSFDEVDIWIHADAGTFSAHLAVPDVGVDSDHLTKLSGRWLCGNDLVVTAIALGCDRS